MSTRSRRLHGGGSGSQQDLRIRKNKGDRRDRDFPHEEDGNDSKEKNEDLRISRLTRSLARLDSEENFFTICAQIEVALNEGENRRYVDRCFTCLCPAFLEVFKGLSGLSWEAAASKRYAQLLSKICSSMEKQTGKLFQWIVEIIGRTAKGSQTYVSSSAYVMEAVSIHLIRLLEYDDVIKFISCVYDVLEDVANPRVFRVLGAIFVCGTNVTASSWRNPHFQDFIDMVVGWMVDVRQSHGQFSSCAELLENSKPQFEKDLRFLLTLMTQLLEDLEQAIKKVQPSSQSDSDEFRKVLQLIRAFTSLEALECPVDKLVLTEFCDKLVTSTLQFIRMCEPHQNMERKYRYDLLTTVNKALFYSGGVLSQSITKYYRAQLKLGTTNSSFLRWPKIFLTSFLESVSVWVEAVISQTQLSDDILEICETLLEMMNEMQKCFPSHDQHYVLTLIACLLRTRNVVLLQKSYVWLADKLPPKDRDQSESLEEDKDILFVMAGLSDLISNKGSSILTLWALQPPVFELLVNIAKMNVNPRTQHCALELLKTHCSIHSHFVSSIASVGSFNTESPGSKFLPALMEFWIQKLESVSPSEKKWLTDWVFEFLQSASSYSSLLYEAKPEFYKRFLEIITQNNSLMLHGAKILQWFCKEPGYSELETLNLLIRDRVVTLILDEKLPERVKDQYRIVLYHMKQLVLLPDIVYSEDCVDSDVAIEDEGNMTTVDTKVNKSSPNRSRSSCTTTALVQTEFNLFLFELLLGNSAHPPNFGFASSKASTNEILSMAADHLIRLKLKTPLGKPQDFFSQLLLLLKRSRASKVPLPIWKLHFMFELEKKFQLWTDGSAVIETEITEHIKQFYLMNKSPFLEWLKRLRSEIIEPSISSGEYSLGYFNSALIGDCNKMEYILYKINDSLGLKGMGNTAASYYLQGKYEEALKLIFTQDEVSNDLSEEIKLDAKKVLEDSYTELQKWPDLTNEVTMSHSEHELMFQRLQYCNSNLLDFQLRNSQKLDLSILKDPCLLESFKLPTLQRINCWLKNDHNKSALNILNEKDNFDSIRIEKMLEAGNVQYVQNWLLKENINISTISSDEDLCNLPLTSLPVSTLKICADFYAKTQDHRKSILLYNILRELDSEKLEVNLAEKITVSLSKRILDSEDFFTVFSSEALSQCSRLETVMSLHDVTLQSFPESANAWLSYGNFLYNHCEKKTENKTEEVKAMKKSVVECYGKFIQLSQKRREDSSTFSQHFRAQNMNLVTMARLLEYFREGIEFDFKEIIVTEEWLVFLAEIAQIPEMRSHMLEKYPDQVSLFFTSHDTTLVANQYTVRRRTLFDLSPYTYVDTSEEPLSSNVVLSNLSQLEKLSTGEAITSKHNLYHFRSNLSIQNQATIFAQELLHVANSMEEMWVWSLERIAVDWSRRLTYLRKECARAFSTEKIQAYIQPILTYLQVLMSNTSSSQSSIDINFLNRHKKDIQKHLDLLSASCSLEEVCETVNSLMRYSERFGQLVNNKLPLSLFSSKLSSKDFYENSSLCLPGQPSHIKICGLHPMVHALPTKTKPKRIRILADNGKYYDYLVKGTENLNIDCGVMLFIKVAQSFFMSPTRTYSVTPLGKRGGLIQIVPDAIPLFTLYKRHLQRNKCLEKTSEMFWGRMNSLGYEDRSSLSALREVFENLSSETSSDLISRELLLSAVTPTQWLNSVQTFTKDCAVGAALGYLLGIGDRHLDNMLVNISQGKFIHVDFSIIFGRGTMLRVPEQVPFRLTQNIRDVLQYPGPSGVFYTVLQDVLTSFQEFRSTAVHLIKNIAFCHQYDEDMPVDPTLTLLSEVDSTIKLLLCRSRQYLSVLRTLRNETQEIVNAGDSNDSIRKVSRKMNRWRRMLVNINTILQFISSATHASSPYDKVTTLTQNQWAGLFQTALETGIGSVEKWSESTTKFLELLDDTEKILQDLQTTLTNDFSPCKLELVKLQDSGVQPIDMDKVEILVKYAEMNIQTYNPTTTVRKLIDEATSVDNLAQMYEGWTPWV